MRDPADKKQVVVIVPIYRTDINLLEQISFIQCLRTLSDHPLAIIKPHHLDLAAFPMIDRFAAIEAFDDSYFSGIPGYNRLMKSPEFYERFLDYEFMLIHQLDVFVFRDELSFWCGRGYDYIGAPWLKVVPSIGRLTTKRHEFRAWLHRYFDIRKRGRPSYRQGENVVGNGGFSLRRVRKFATLAHQFRKQAERSDNVSDNNFNEDLFWSIEVNRRVRHLRRPHYLEALSFSFEYSLDQSMRLTNGRLPFGCHAWHRNLDFWRPFIEARGYMLPAVRSDGAAGGQAHEPNAFSSPRGQDGE
ncbi:MAG: hypothetical protein JNK47_16155 [Mesorhizobium sp.]|nr:DUF5672 family protein [Mesorhizobium sp.]MBL8578756.1 hypothetical protein [Mesorhizobium sp.]